MMQTGSMPLATWTSFALGLTSSKPRPGHSQLMAELLGTSRAALELLQHSQPRTSGVSTSPPGCSATTDRFQLASSDSAYARDEKAWLGTSPTSLNTSIGDDLTKISFAEAKRILAQTHPFLAPFPHPSFGIAAMAGYIALAWHIIAFLLHRRPGGAIPHDSPPAYASAPALPIPVPDFKLGH